jgi:hypothetical protein
VGTRRFGEELTATFDDLGPFLDVDLDEPQVPAIVSGRVDPGVGRVAVVVNGVVAAVVDTHDDQGPGRFAAIVPPRLLRDGTNRVTVNRP